MKLASQNVAASRSALTADLAETREKARPDCPACGAAAEMESLERCGKYALYECAACELQFWEPREMPSVTWYEQMYGGRDQKLLPLEPGHKCFLSDERAPGKGKLLDVGCGTGNFLLAARAAGYGVTGTELDKNAAEFARGKLGARVLPTSIGEFSEKPGNDGFDVITFFEVLEHQAAPREFLQCVRRCLRKGGFVALSVPNRERWLTGPDVLDYPPNHFLRWNRVALRRMLETQGFEILTIREQMAGVRHTAQMFHMALRTGLSRKSAGGALTSFREVMQMPLEEAGKTLNAAPTKTQSVMQVMGRMKYAACFPLALAAYPYVKWRGYKGTYLYALARLRD
jgi:2-polyprenyl-3-methyl-5-hydroxy-6-metoxy-1,4-benzoquinol methylase